VNLVKDRPAIRTIRAAASHGAAVWAIYGIVETAFTVFSPLVRQALFAVVPTLVPGGRGPGISSTFTAFVLIVYPVVGAVLGASVAVPLVSFGTVRRLLSRADSVTLWSSVGTLTLGLAFGLNALLAKQPSVVPAVVVPIALGMLRLGAAWRPDWRHRWPGLTQPLTIIATLTGTAFLCQRRSYMPALAGRILGFGYTAAALFFAVGLYRVWASTRLCRAIERRLPRAWVSAMLVAGLVLTWTALAAGFQRPLPQAQSRPGPASDRPNVVLITLDTVRADHLSLYGYSRDTTPNLRRLAATSATVYTRAIASSNCTLPSHASIFTGQSPRRHGAHASPKQPGGFRISERSITLPELLAQDGYRTAGIVANYGNLSPAFGFDRGFSSYECAQYVDFLTLTGRTYLLRELLRDLTAAVIAPERREALYASAKTINSRAARVLESTSRARQPFFLFLNYMDAHTPYVPPAPFDSRFAGRDAAFRWSGYRDLVDEVSVRHVRPLGDRERRHLISQYDGAIAYLDDQLGGLFTTLKALGLFENSLIIVTSDHGEAFGESSIVAHGVSVYQHQVHVPLIIKYPHSSHGAVVDGLVSDVDLLPTILDVIGAPVPQNVEGRSLRHVELLASRWITSESYYPRGAGFTSSDARATEIALYSGFFKQILGAGGGTELYDLSKDPSETMNIYGWRAMPKEWQARLATYMEEARTQSRSNPVTDPEVLERLNALGYIR
jgi:arylsulfatase A-like enzyme